MKKGDPLRLASADDGSPVLVDHNALITALATLVFQWECEVEIRLAPELANVLAALSAAGRPYATIKKVDG